MRDTQHNAFVCFFNNEELSVGGRAGYLNRYQITQDKRGSVQPGCILGGLRFDNSGVSPYDFLNLYGIFNSRFCINFPKKRLELKSL